MFAKLFEQFGKYGKLNQSETNYLKEHIRIKQYRKNEQILVAGQVPRTIYFVLKGYVRLYYNVDGKDKTAYFYHENDFIWTFKSIEHDVITQKYYEAIEDTIVITIDKHIVRNLLKSSHNFELITRNIKELELVSYQQLIANFVTLSPTERFINLLETNSQLFQKVPQQHIASYLGVSPETLSRIKKRIYAYS